jgi:hypothetical protein
MLSQKQMQYQQQMQSRRRSPAHGRIASCFTYQNVVVNTGQAQTCTVCQCLLALLVFLGAQVKLAISYALAQSTKLSLHERRVTQMVADTKYLPESLAATGKVALSNDTIAKLIGKVRGQLLPNACDAHSCAACSVSSAVAGVL